MLTSVSVRIAIDKYLKSDKWDQEISYPGGDNSIF